MLKFILITLISILAIGASSAKDMTARKPASVDCNKADTLEYSKIKIAEYHQMAEEGRISSLELRSLIKGEYDVYEMNALACGWVKSEKVEAPKPCMEAKKEQREWDGMLLNGLITKKNFASLVAGQKELHKSMNLKCD